MYMKKAVNILCLALFTLGIGTSAQAQFRQSIFLNGNLPTGSFASDINTDRIQLVTGSNVPLGYTEIGKDASIGFGAGYRASYRFDVGMGMVAPFAQADFYWNTISGDLSEEYTQARAKSTPTYFNIPIQVGVSYLYDELWNDITPYAEFGLGADLMFITQEGPFTINQIEYGKYNYNPSTAFSFSIGLGAYFGNHVSAGLYYYGFGKHTIEYTNGTVENLNAPERAAYESGDVQTRTAGSLALRIGFHF